MKKLIVTLFMTAASLASSMAFAVPTTLILSRHAEKGSGENPELTKEGKDRAKALTKLKHLYTIAQVYSTSAKRTVATAEPIAKEMNLKVNTAFSGKQFKEMLSDISKNHAGKTVMVVGHSDTVPDILNHLTKSDLYKEIDITDYSNLFIIQFDGAGPAQVHRYRQVVGDDKLTLEPRQ